jgi:hypothetical protein
MWSFGVSCFLIHLRTLLSSVGEIHASKNLQKKINHFCPVQNNISRTPSFTTPRYLSPTISGGLPTVRRILDLEESASALEQEADELDLKISDLE